MKITNFDFLTFASLYFQSLSYTYQNVIRWMILTNENFIVDRMH